MRIYIILSCIMKVNKFQPLLILVFILLIAYAYKSRKQNTQPIPSSSLSVAKAPYKTQKQISEVTSVSDNNKTQDSLTEIPLAFEETSTDEIKRDPLHNKIIFYYTEVQKRHEELLKKVLQDNNKEDLYDDYLALKKERAENMLPLIKKDNSQKAMFNFNLKYHERLHKVFGDKVYKEYLQSLKKVNNEFKKTKIVLDF